MKRKKFSCPATRELRDCRRNGERRCVRILIVRIYRRKVACTNRRVINARRSGWRNKLLASMNIFISLHQYSEPTFLTALKSTKIERRGTRSAFDRMRHDLRFLITTFYAFAIRVSIREGVEIYRRNRNDDSFLSRFALHTSSYFH